MTEPADPSDSGPDVPEPDDKDWTWVLDRPCPECGFDAAEVERSTVPERIVDTADVWRGVLRRPDVRVRPAARTWSALEYAAHVCDVYGVFASRARLMVEQDDPEFANWDQDAAALQKRYWDSDPGELGAELSGAAFGAAGVFGSVSGEQWQRVGRRSNGSVFTVDTLARYFLHDVVHHLYDVGAHA